MSTDVADVHPEGSVCRSRSSVAREQSPSSCSRRCPDQGVIDGTARDTEAREVHDSWGHPIVYIYNADYDKTFIMRNDFGEDVEVEARKRPDGTYYNPDTFQIISLGENLVQDFEEFSDDIMNFKVEDKE